MRSTVALGWFIGRFAHSRQWGHADLRLNDYFVDEDDEYLDFELLDQLRVRPVAVANYTDVEAALALADLRAQVFLLYGTGGGQHIDDQSSREGMRTLVALTKRSMSIGSWTSETLRRSTATGWPRRPRKLGARRTMVWACSAHSVNGSNLIEDEALGEELVTPVPAGSERMGSR